jgi:hypothetical protein
MAKPDQTSPLVPSEQATVDPYPIPRDTAPPRDLALRPDSDFVPEPSLYVLSPMSSLLKSMGRTLAAGY